MRSGLHKVIGIDRLTDLTYMLRLERNDMSFVPGQCFNLGLPDTAVNREYSSYSGIYDEELQFLIRQVEGGQVSPKFKHLRAGDTVEVDGAYGMFVIDPELIETRKFYFIATGTGIAPFHCFAKSYRNLDYQLIHGTRHGNECYHRQDYEKGRYINCSTADSNSEFHGRVTDYLKANPPPVDAMFYLCGNRNMINEAYDILRSHAISSSQIITEVFF